MRISLPFFILGFPPTPASASKGEMPFARVLGAEGAAPGAAPIPSGAVAAPSRADSAVAVSGRAASSAAPMDRIFERDVAGERTKGAPAPAFVFGAFGGAAPIPTGAAAVARPVAVATPDPVMPPDTVVERDVAGEAMKGAAAPAFAFGAFGVFAPGRHGATASDAAALQAAAITAAAEVRTPDAMAARALGAVVVAGAVDAVAAGDRASTPGLRIAAPFRAVATTHVAAAAWPPSAPPTPEAPAAEETVASGGAPRPPVATPRRTPSASLVVVERDGRLSVVAAAPDLKPGDHAQVRLRLASAAAELGASLEDLHINGEAGTPPAKGGPRHGHRAR